jgi:lysophospholipase L1-like esterase
MKKRAKIVSPGLFSAQVAADSRRKEFDFKNEQILTNRVPVDFVFIGDSITQLWELSIYFGGKGCINVNRGISGDLSKFVLKRFEADVIQLKPKLAVLKIGVNDTWILEENPFFPGPPKSANTVRKAIVKNIGGMVRLCVENKQKLAVCSILPTNFKNSPKRDYRNNMIVEANQELKELAENNKMIYVDYHSHMVKEDGITIRDELADDGLHPHVLGYNIMADVLRKTLKKKKIDI